MTKAFRLRSALAAVIPFAALLCGPPSATAAGFLGTAQPFAILGATTVTSTGATTITGDLGVYPGTAITGFPPGTVTGTVHAGDAVAMAAQADALTAYNALAALAPTADLTGMDLGGKTLDAGVYKFDSTAGLTGALDLNFTGPNQSIVFQIGSSLTENPGSTVVIPSPATSSPSRATRSPPSPA
jgi:type VI secretion system secreted protein VgrG